MTLHMLATSHVLLRIPRIDGTSHSSEIPVETRPLLLLSKTPLARMCQDHVLVVLK